MEFFADTSAGLPMPAYRLRSSVPEPLKDEGPKLLDSSGKLTGKVNFAYAASAATRRTRVQARLEAKAKSVRAAVEAKKKLSPADVKLLASFGVK